VQFVIENKRCPVIKDISPIPLAPHLPDLNPFGRMLDMSWFNFISR
jgi:hypothetical protein